MASSPPTRPPTLTRLLPVLILLIWLSSVTIAQISNPIASDEQHSAVHGSDMLARDPLDEANVTIGTHTDDHEHTKAVNPFTPSAKTTQHGMEIAWTYEVGSSVYTTPIIADVNSDGKKDVVVASFVHHIEIIGGNTGRPLPGWPYSFQDSVFHASPIFHDVDRNGDPELIVFTANAEIVFLKKDGLPFLGATLVVPKLKVAKNWYHNLRDEGGEWYDKNKSRARNKNRNSPKSDHDQPSIPSDISGTGGFNPLSTRLPSGASSSYNLFMVDRIAGKYGVDNPLQTLFDSNWNHTAEAGFTYVDAHILASPAIADIDNDGKDDLVVAVSYFYDPEYYADPANLGELDEDVDPEKYVAGGIVVYDLTTKSIKWSEQLDLTTDDTKYRAYIYSSPTIVDLDRDKTLDIVIGTSLGFIYVLNHRGELRSNWPQQMAEIQGQLTVADVNQDGQLEILAVDSHGSVVAWDRFGKPVWDTQILGFSAQNAVVGDINGDKESDVVITTTSGFVYALSGKDGSVLEHFPLKTNGRILSPALIVDLDGDGTHSIVTPSFDGYLYIMDARKGTVDKFDFGENSYTQVLADDLTGNGKIDLLLSTMNGNVMCLSTDGPHHPLQSWASQTHSLNGFAPRSNYGVFVQESSRAFRDINGDTFTVIFEIVDDRPPQEKSKNPVYRVRVHVANLRSGFKTYSGPGVYSETLPAPKVPRTAGVKLEMWNEHGQLFTDSFAVTFNLHFYKTFKWIILVPFVAMASILLFVENLRTPLPS